MHPSREELIAYLDGNLTDPARREDISRHVEVCEFCGDFCRRYGLLTEPDDLALDKSLPEKLRQLRDSIYEAALGSSVIDLKPLSADGQRPTVSYLAADGTPEKRPSVQNLATLFSEDPEVVLRVMRDSAGKSNYLQVMAEDTRLSAHVMVRLPELKREFITDASGRAEIDLAPDQAFEKLKWQIKMPEAVFSLEPLKYDPDRIEYTRETALETDRHDRIEFRLEGMTEGKRLLIKVVQLDGRTDFGPLRVTVTQGDTAHVTSVEPGETVEIGPIDPDNTIDIRLYQ